MIDSLLCFGQQEHLPISIEYIDKAAFEKPITVQLRDRTMRQVMDDLTHPLGYRWSTEGGVVTVTHTEELVGKRNLLNTRISRFQIAETSMHEANLALYLHLYFALNPHSRGIVGDSLGGNQTFRAGPFNMTNATVRQILNRIVSQHDDGAWVIQQPPWTMDKDLGHGIWKVLEYDKPDCSFSKELLMWGLGLQNH